MRALVIINPIAGSGRRPEIRARAALAESILGGHGCRATVRVTTAPGDARIFAHEAVADGVELVVAWGGDGTVNGVASALIGTGVALGIVPAGSGNGLARDLALPSDPARALTVAATGTLRAIDAGELHGSLFFNVAGVGLDASIAARLADPGARRGLIGYAAATVAELRQHEPWVYRIQIPASDATPAVPGERIERRALFVAFANSRQYGNGARIAPAARLDDGEIDLVVVEPLSPLRIAARIPALFLGTLRNGPGLVMRRAASFAISADRPIPFHVDGEPRAGAETLALCVHPGALQVRVEGSRVR